MYCMCQNPKLFLMVVKPWHPFDKSEEPLRAIRQTKTRDYTRLHDHHLSQRACISIWKCHTHSTGLQYLLSCLCCFCPPYNHRFLPRMQGKHPALKQCPMTCTVKNVSPGLQHGLYKESRCDGGHRCSATDQPGLLQYSNSASNTLECLHVHTEIALDNELTSPVPNICGAVQDVLSENPVFICNQVHMWFSFISFLHRVFPILW